MKRIISYVLGLGLLSGIASYDTSSQVKNKALEERVEWNGLGHVKGTVLDVDEDSFLFYKRFEDGGEVSTEYNNFVFETITLSSGRDTLRLIHMGPSNYTKGEAVTFDYDVFHPRSITFQQLLNQDHRFVDPGHKLISSEKLSYRQRMDHEIQREETRAQLGSIKADGLIREYGEVE